MTASRVPCLLALAAAAAATLAAPGAVPAQEADPLVKSEVVRLLVTDTYGPEERRQIVRRSCLTFSPTAEDLEDFRRLGAGEELLGIIRDCDAGEEDGAGQAEGPAVPPAPGQVSVSAPAALYPSDTGGVSLLALPGFDTVLEERRVRLPPRPSDRENFLATVEVPPRLQNAAEIQRMLYRAAPDAAFGRQGTVRCVLWVFVDPTGSVREVRIAQSSGNDAFDRTAVQVADSMRFSPGTTGTRPAGMWVQQSLSIRR